VGIQQPPKPTPADVGLPVHAKDNPPAKSPTKGARKP
jgi:hypothetical protein